MTSFPCAADETPPQAKSNSQTTLMAEHRKLKHASLLQDFVGKFLRLASIGNMLCTYSFI